MDAHTNPTGYFPKANHWYTPRAIPGTLVNIDSPNCNGTHFPYFSIGVGGSISVFDPPESYWGTAKPTGGGGSTYTIPVGMQYPQDVDFVNRTWNDPSKGELHTLSRPWVTLTNIIHKNLLAMDFNARLFLMAAGLIHTCGGSET